MAYRVGRRANRRITKRGARVHRKNRVSGMRGGISL